MDNPASWEADLELLPFKFASHADAKIAAAWLTVSANEFDRLRAVNAELCAALERALQLVAKAHAERTYEGIVAGPGYVDRVFRQANDALAKARP